MTEQPWRPTDRELEQALRDLGEHLAYPPAPDLAPAVRLRLLAEQQTAPSTSRARRSAGSPIQRLRGRVALLLVALTVLGGAILALSPGARTAVASWLSLHGVVFFNASALHRPLPPVGTHLRLGRRVTLAQAQVHAGFHIVLPAALPQPDEVYLGTPGQGGPMTGPPPGQAVQVALVYRAGPQLPHTTTTGVGLLLTELQGSPLLGKFLDVGTRVEPVTVHGAPGYWLTGKPHGFGYLGPNGQPYIESVRLAGNVLLWQHGTLLLRLESALPKAAALRIASSVR